MSQHEIFPKTVLKNTKSTFWRTVFKTDYIVLQMVKSQGHNIVANSGF